jgi:hypothetical protein
MPKRNIYLSDDDIELWDSLPKGQRGRMLRDFLLDRKIKSMDIAHYPVVNMSDAERKRENIRVNILDLEKNIIMLKMEKASIIKNIKSKERVVKQKKTALDSINDEINVLNKKYTILENEYEEIFGSFSEDNLVIPSDAWNHIYLEAKKNKGAIFTYLPKPEKEWIFKIKNVKNGKVEIERLDHSSGPSSSIITLRLIEEIVEKFNREAEWYGVADARIKSGSSFIGDHSIESAIVFLYRRMKYDGEWIIFSEGL